MRFENVCIIEPYMTTLQLLGFGFLLYCREAYVPEMVERIEKDILALPIYPGWRFAIVTPWH